MCLRVEDDGAAAAPRSGVPRPAFGVAAPRALVHDAHEVQLGRRNPKLAVGVAHVEAQGYRIEQPIGPLPAPTLFTMWLSGECYAA